MADLQLLLEAERRGILPPDRKTLLDEARRRGLIEDTPPPAEPAPTAAPEEAKPLGGFWSAFSERMKLLPELGDEAAAFAANPNEENRKALIAAGNSKYRGAEFGEGENWAAFKQLIGGSLGSLVAPAIAGTAGSIATPLVGAGAAYATNTAQYQIDNLMRQAQEQERAIAEGRTPEELQLGKSVAASAAQAGLDVVQFNKFAGLLSKFPFLRNLVSSEKEVVEDSARKLVEAARSGNLTSVSGGVIKGAAQGVAFEVPQEIAQQAIERWQAGLSLSDDEAVGEYKQAAIGAALLGPAMGGAAGAIGGRGEQRQAEALLASSDKAQARLAEITANPAPTPEEQTEAEYIRANADNPLELAKKYGAPRAAQQQETEQVEAPPKPPETAEELLNATPKVLAENAPVSLQNEPRSLTDDQVYAEIDKIEQEREQLASLIFDPVQIQAQADAAKQSIEQFTTGLTGAYDSLTTRFDVFQKNFMQRMEGDPAATTPITVTTPPEAPRGTEPATSETVGGAGARGAELPVSRAPAEGRGPAGIGTEGLGVPSASAERVDEREEGVEPALTPKAQETTELLEEPPEVKASETKPPITFPKIQGATGPERKKTLGSSDNNSTGRPIHPTAQGVLNFRNWFRRSQTVDDARRPVVYYHGSKARNVDEGGIKIFRRGVAGAIFASDNPVTAGSFAREGNENAAVYPIYIRAENLFDYENSDHVKIVLDRLFPEGKSKYSDRANAEDRLKHGDWGYIESSKVQQAIKNLGHDGFYVKEFGTKNIAVYNADQIKSAVGNTGEFSSINKEIQGAAKPQSVRLPATAEQKKALADRISERITAQGEVRKGGVGPFGKENIVVSDVFGKNMAGFVRGILKSIGLGDKKILLISKSEIMPDARGATGSKYKMYEAYNYAVDETAKYWADKSGTYGTVIPLPEDGYMIVVDEKLEMKRVLETIGHEIGHIIEAEMYANADSKVKRAVQAAYQKWLTENGKKDTAKLYQRTRAWSMAHDTLIDGVPEDSVLSEEDQKYVTSFAEWFADNVAKWMTTSEKPLNIVDKFFADVAKELRKLLGLITRSRPEFLPDQAVKNFLDGLAPLNEDMAKPIIKEAIGFKGPRSIFPSIEGIKNFWNWFSDSTVADEDGRPIIMYHGSPYDFSIFRPKRAKAIFVSPDPYFAAQFAYDALDDVNGMMYPVYIYAKNPFDFDNFTHVSDLEAALTAEGDKSVRKVGSDDWLSMMSSIREGDWRVIEQPDVQRIIRKLGHDGFYVSESLYSAELGDRVEAKNLAVFDPKQVKSALGNNGKFSKKTGKIQGATPPTGPNLNNVAAAVKAQPSLNKRVYDGVRETLDSTRITDNMREALYAFLSLPQQVELFVKELPMMRGLLNLLNVRASALKNRREVLDRNVRRWSKVIKKHSKYTDEFYEIANESTRLQVEFNNANFAAHPLTQRFNRLPPALQKVYWDMLSSYRGMADEYLQLISKNLSPRESMRLQREMAKKRLKVYLPLYREGDYWLRYQDAQNDTVVRSFTSNYAREQAWEEAKRGGAQKGSEQFYSKIEDFFDGKGPGTFFNKTLEELKNRNAPESVKRALYELYLDQIPASSVRQLYRKRDGYKGYESDLINVYSSVATRMANQLTNLEYVPEIDKAYKEVQDEAKAYSAAGKSKNRAVAALMKNMDKQMEYLRDPANGSVVNTLSSFSYYMYIIGNVSTAVINMTQIPMVVYPMLMGKYGVDKAGDAITLATKQYFKGGFDNDNIPGGEKRFPSDFTFGVGLPPNSPLDRLYKAAVAQSAIRRSTGYDVVQGRKKKYTRGDYIGLMTKTEQILGWTFQNSERFNREVTLIAAFNLEMEKNGGDVDGAIRYALDLVTQAHGTVLTETSPRIFQTGVGKVIFTFKNFAQTQIYLQAKLLREAVKGETPEVKMIAAKQLIGIMGTAFTFSGIYGLPFYSATTLLVDLLMDFFGDDDDPIKSNEIIRQAVGSMAYKGPVSEMLMTDISSRTGFNSLLWKDNDKRLEEVGPVLFAAEQIAGPAYAAGMGFFRAYKDYSDGHYDRAVEAMLPSFLRNMLKANRFAMEGATSRDGELIYDDFNKYELAMQALGFTPVETAKRTEIAGALAKRMSDLNQRKTALYDRYYLARMNGDVEGVKETKAAVKKYNQNEFVRKTRNMIMEDDLVQSYNRRKKNVRDSVYGINVPQKARRAAIEQYMLEEDK